jgi:hypothetical protein
LKFLKSPLYVGSSNREYYDIGVFLWDGGAAAAIISQKSSLQWLFIQEKY